MNIRLHIDQIVLDGVSAGAGGVQGLQAALESELGRLLTESHGSSLGEVASVARLRGDAIRISPGQSSTELGVAIARSVFAGVNPERP